MSTRNTIYESMYGVVPASDGDEPDDEGGAQRGDKERKHVPNTPKIIKRDVV